MSGEERPTVGFVGLGEQGTPIALRILDHEYPLVIWARRQASLAPFEGTAAIVAADLADLSSRSDIVCVCVLNDQDVEDVLHGGIIDSLKPSGLIVVNSTTRPGTVRRLAQEAAAHGLSLIDAPVSGMARGAAAGTMAIFVGGAHEDFERYAPIARTFGTPTHMGAIGSGQIVKLLNNTTAVCNLVIAQDTLAIGAALGIDRDVLSKAMMSGSSASKMFQTYLSFDCSPVLCRDPAFFLRDWSRILSDLASVLEEEHVDGRMTHKLGQMFVQRTDDYVSSLA
jgi:3-hydroxyisobutyrate dehydrogenase